MLKKFARFAMAEDGSIKARVIRSGIWVATANIVGLLFQFGRSIVLARLLTPEAFGIMGLATIALRTVETVTRPGVAQALIARQREFDEAASTAFTMLLLRGGLLAVLLLAIAPWVASFYDEQLLQSVLYVLAAVFVINGFSNINTIARQKELDFRRLTYLGVATTILGSSVTIALAFWLRSVWALVFGQLASAMLSAGLSYVVIPGRVRFVWNGAIARDLLQYGKFVTGSSIVLFTATELDSAVIGKLLGMEQLGFYAVAFMIANLATTNLSKVASSIMMPAYSKLQSDARALRNAYLRTLNLVLHVVVPTAAGLILLARPVVELIYGSKWLPAVEPLQILAAFGVVRAMTSFNGHLFEGTGRPAIAFKLGLLRLVVIVPAIIPAVIYWGLNGAAATVVVGIVVQWLGGLTFLHRHFAIGMRELVTAAVRPVVTTVVMGAVVYASAPIALRHGMVGLIAVVTGGVATYVFCNLSILRALLRERPG